MNPNDRSSVSIKLFGPLKDFEMKTIIRSAQRFAKAMSKGSWPDSFKPRPNIDRDIEILRLTDKKVHNGSGMSPSTDNDIAARIFSDEGVELGDLGEYDRKNRLKLIQARKRIAKALRDRFPDDTFAT